MSLISMSLFCPRIFGSAFAVEPHGPQAQIISIRVSQQEFHPRIEKRICLASCESLNSKAGCELSHMTELECFSSPTRCSNLTLQNVEETNKGCMFFDEESATVKRPLSSQHDLECVSLEVGLAEERQEFEGHIHVPLPQRSWG